MVTARRGAGGHTFVIERTKWSCAARSASISSPTSSSTACHAVTGEAMARAQQGAFENQQSHLLDRQLRSVHDPDLSSDSAMMAIRDLNPWGGTIP